MIGPCPSCYDGGVRLRSLTCLLLGIAGCGPGGLPSLEGFGSIGETEDPPGDGDGDPGDGDGEPGDGDGEPGECINVDFTNDALPTIYLEDYVDASYGNDHEGMCAPNPGPDYSIAWRAPQSGSYRATLYEEFGGWLTVQGGGCDGWLENCGAFGFPTVVDFEASAGQDYTFVIDSEFEDASGYFTFTLEPISIPTECPWGELFDVPATMFDSTFGASNGFGSSCGGDDAPDRSYIFYPWITGSYRIDTEGSDFDTMLHVFEGYCGGNEIDCNDDTPQGTTSELFVNFQAGGVYTIVVDGWGGSAGNYQLNLELIDGVGVCDNIEILESSVPTGAAWLSDQDIGNVFGQCSFASLERRHLWYAPEDGLYLATLQGPQSSSLAVALDGCGGSNTLCNQGPIQFEAFAGQEIVFISEWESAGVEDMALLVEAVGGTPGCGIELPSDTSVFVSGTTNGAGDQYTGECAENPAPEIEYWWTAPVSSTYLISLEGSSYDTLMYVREGGCDGPEISCSDDTFEDENVYLWSSIDIDLAAGQTISIFVDGYSSSGTYELRIKQP